MEMCCEVVVLAVVLLVKYANVVEIIEIYLLFSLLLSSHIDLKLDFILNVLANLHSAGFLLVTQDSLNSKLRSPVTDQEQDPGLVLYYAINGLMQ